MTEPVRVFFSYSRPIFAYQERFLSVLLDFVRNHPDTEAIVLGAGPDTAVDPLRSIVAAIDRSAGLIALAFRRNRIDEGTQRIVTPDGDVQLRDLNNKWLTSSYCHIEVALAFRAAIPLLILQEQDVVAEGVLDRSSTGEVIEVVDPESFPESVEQLGNSGTGVRVSAWLSQARQFSAAARVSAGSRRTGH